MVKIKRYLVKIDRISAWILFFLIILYFIAGWSMTGRISLLEANQAKFLHTSFCIVLLIFFLIHSGIQIYFAAKRWKRKK